MDILPYNFRACQMAGMWYEEEEDERPRGLKMLYRVFVSLLILQHTLSLIIELVLMEGSVSEFAQRLYMTCTYIVFSLKLGNFVGRRREMSALIGDLRSPACRGGSTRERDILARRSSTARVLFLSLMTMSQSIGAMLLAVPFMEHLRGEVYLPPKAHQFIDISNETHFWLASALQFLTVVYAILLNVSMDTMAYGFLLLTTGQFEISFLRFAGSDRPIKECIQHYVLVKAIALQVQSFFMRVIVPLFCLSLVTLCTSIFEMSQKRIGSFEFLSLAMYFLIMLFQLYLYCLFGHELDSQSRAVTDAVYFRKWYDYTIQEKKNICCFMLYAQRGSNISLHGLCNLSLNTFIWIAKTSYAALNLLQQATTED